jgi:polysaccharide export outer membrane protein
MDPLVSGKGDPDLPVDLVVLTPADIDAYAKPDPVARGTVDRKRVTGQEYVIAPGDVIRVSIYEAAAGWMYQPVQAGGSVFDQMRVEGDGTVNIPYVGRIHVAGKTAATLEVAVEGILRTKALTAQPAVQVMVWPLTSAIHVSGDVHSPGTFSMVSISPPIPGTNNGVPVPSGTGPQTVLDAVDLAGGPNALTDDVILRRNSMVKSFSVEELMLGGEDQSLQPEDDILVEPHLRNFVAMGAVSKAGLFPFLTYRTTLLTALGQVGGLVDNQADPTGVFIFRSPAAHDGRAKPKVFVLNFSSPTAIFLASRFAVEPDDAIYVTNAPVYQIGKVIQVFSGAGELTTSGKSLTGQ